MGHKEMYLICMSVLFCVCYSQDIVVSTQYGEVRGQTVRVDNAKEVTTVHAFNGVPYAKDTSGARRFQMPEAMDSWAPAVRDATVPGDACPQTPYILQVTNPGWSRISEDCLHLNIISPNVRTGPHAVMIYFHGGGYSSGANFQYPGHFLASHGVVSVNVNYRLNTFGFAYTGNAAAPGNAGLWDQKMAIQFVRDNIGNFGGDPDRITVFGESAGACSAGLHMLSPQSKDLFQQAIFESGADTSDWAFSSPESNPEDNIRRVAEQLECNNTDDFIMIECLQGLSWQNIYYNASSAGFSPVVDGPGGFLPKTPAELRADGDILKGPIMSGINNDETSIFLPGIVPEVIFGCCNRSYYMHVLRERIVPIWFSETDNVTQENIAQAFSFNYSPWPYIYSNWENRQALVYINTDNTFGEDWDRQVKLHSDVAPTWAFIFNYRGRNTSQVFPEWMGVPHIAEIPYVWGHTLIPTNDEVYNNSWVNFDLVDWTEQDIEFTYFVQELWTNFANFGNPTPSAVENPVGGSTVWPEYTFDEMNVLMIGNTSIETQVGYRQQSYAFWNDYIPYLSGETEGEDSVDGVSMLVPDIMGDLMSTLTEDILDLLVEARRAEGSLLNEDFWQDW